VVDNGSGGKTPSAGTKVKGSNGSNGQPVDHKVKEPKGSGSSSAAATSGGIAG
jgi:hypothetical protein